MQDADFDDATLFDIAQPVYFQWTSFAQADAYEGPGAGGTFDVEGAPVDCTIDGVGLSDPPRTVTFNLPLFDGLDFSASVRDAMDTILAAHPTITHFTLEPFTSMGTHNAINACGDPSAGFAYGYDRDFPPPAWAQVQGEFGTDTEQPQSWDVDGSPADVAVKAPGRTGLGQDWFVADSWGPLATEYADDPGVYLDDGGAGPGSRWGTLGTTSARQAYLLRPTPLSWPGQDAANSANRIFWRDADVTGDEHHRIAGTWGHVSGSAFMKVRGWTKIGAPAPWMCVV